jgi:cold shock CspA family protein
MQVAVVRLGKEHMPTGRVKWFSAAKGFGFISPDDGSNDVFLHIAKVEEANLPTLESGTALQYSIGARNGKAFAEGLSIVSKPMVPSTGAGN